MNPLQSKRRNYFIKKSFQTHFSFRFALLAALEAGLITLLFIYISSGTLTTGYYGTELRIEKTSTFFLLSLSLIVLIAAVAVWLTAMLVFIFYSHRIAGPLFRFEQALEQIGKGDVALRLRLREKDQLAELGSSINQMNESLDAKIGAMRREAEAASKLLASGDSAKAREHLDRLKQAADSFRTS